MDIIDVSKLGLNSGLLLLQTNLNMEDKDKFIQNISKMSSVYSLIELTGKYDLLVSFYYKEDKDNIVEEIIPTGTIKDFKFAKIKTYFPRIDYNREIFSKNNLVDYKNLKVNVDERDIEILGVIANNCRQSKVNLGEKLKISRETVNYRLKKLIESGVIAKFQASVNPFVLGFESYFLKIKLLKPTQRKKIISFLNQSLRCNTILSSDSLWDVATFIHFKSHQEFREFEGLLLKHYKEAIQEYSFEYVKRQYKLDWLGMVFGSNSIHFYR